MDEHSVFLVGVLPLGAPAVSFNNNGLSYYVKAESNFIDLVDDFRMFWWTWSDFLKLFIIVKISGAITLGFLGSCFCFGAIPPSQLWIDASAVFLSIFSGKFAT